jgi:hypothetical protein
VEGWLALPSGVDSHLLHLEPGTWENTWGDYSKDLSHPTDHWIQLQTLLPKHFVQMIGARGLFPLRCHSFFRFIPFICFRCEHLLPTEFELENQNKKQNKWLIIKTGLNMCKSYSQCCQLLQINQLLQLCTKFGSFFWGMKLQMEGNRRKHFCCNLGLWITYTRDFWKKGSR